MKSVKGGVCAPKGFYAAGIHCGVKASSPAEKNDLMLIFSEKKCSACGMYTKNVVKAASVLLTRENLRNGAAQAVVANSGNANACCDRSDENARRMCAAAAEALGVNASDVAVGSTGVIGQRINIRAIESGIQTAAAFLSRDGSDAAARAIMTTDTAKKEFAVSAVIGGKSVKIGGIAKGSGMIHPNMGTMLCFITTDCSISKAMLKAALREAVRVSFNRISVDGDTSTNDTCVALANGMAKNVEIRKKDEGYELFAAALTALCVKLARAMAKDGEGAKHLITCFVSGAKSEAQAETIGKSVIGSSLTKAAIFGADANWGRVLCAMGYSGESFDPEKVTVSFSSGAGRITVCRAGRGLKFDEDKAKKILSEDEVVIGVKMGEGSGSATCWGCDLTYDYVKINGDYRT
jgi:glutamate N-acetyltransferase/amino-acid N-acetyltransferase